MINSMKKSTLSIIILFFLASAASYAQTRGVGVRVKNDSGKTEDIKLYEGSYALVIGESDYTAGWKGLPGVKEDVRAISAALKEQGFAVTELLNPTRGQLTGGIDDFINRHGFDAGNRLLIYYAGHGHTQKAADGRELGYIVPSDAPLPDKDERLFRQTALNMNEIENYARRIEAKHALFVFDSCFSGSLLTKRRSAAPPVITLKTTQPVRQFITAGSDEQEVPDQSVFRRQFVEGIKGEADSNADGYVTGSELADFLQTKVTNYTRGSQTPQYGKIFDPLLDRGDFVFVLPKGTSSPVAVNEPATSERLDSSSIETEFWNSIKNSTDVADFNLYKQKYPNGAHTDLADLNISRLSRQTSPVERATSAAAATGNAMEHFTKGMDFAAKMDFDAAIREFGKAIEVNPAAVDAYYQRGVAFYFKKDNQSALSDFNKVIELNPRMAIAYIYRAGIYRARNEVGLARRDMDTAIEVDPRSWLAYSTRAADHFTAGEYAAAISDYTKAIEIHPEDSSSYTMRAFAYEQTGQKSLAKADRQKAKELGGK